MENKETVAESPAPETSELPELERLRGEVEFLKAELEASKNKFLRLYADFENYKKRMVQELESAQRNGKFDAVRALLGTLDDLERALGFASVKPEDLIPGVRSVLENFARSLKGLGVEAVPGVGAEFDPRYHEAIGAVEGEEGKVMHVYQQGFRYGDLLVRPARVVVGNGVKEAEGSEPGAHSEKN
ncbi:MAG: nucleotide exchange factor GrpE [Meiothermus sp.]|uniref:nucleotide exchange factor GrpE n=1 Tax=Meiothermus sp. TaxID=1955249 RepID=UPI0025ED86D2|nr:nucleotide exchange factor GrpE [Meiothermus sp.]MCS7068495.1 nucleotide exchange factor GrpE [Meiothermus sp.]MCX7601869.1 nucleotide exchange factor GrpE [Meiothermus sp.]MDW8425277.1 nucleotide exchange factor GrpE [Meiothermus sp.]